MSTFFAPQLAKFGAARYNVRTIHEAGAVSLAPAGMAPELRRFVMHPQSTYQQLPLQAEEWRAVVGYEGLYEVSNLGRVRRVGAGRGATVGRILETRSDRNGYRFVELTHHGQRHGVSVHRLVAAAFLGPSPEGQQVNHIDRDKMNSALSNLEYVTPSENVAHAYRTGVVPRQGIRHGMAKLTEEQVRAIRAASGTLKEIGDRFGVHLSTIHLIRSEKHWRHLSEDGAHYVY